MSIPNRSAMHPVKVRRRSLPAAVVALLLASTPLSVDAKDCNSKGGLFYLGNTRDDAKSVWLSATSAGAFRLDAAQGNTTVDQWTKSNRGLNITASPFVSNGNGGTHKLYDTSDKQDCLLDTQNQKGGINLPQLNFPNLKPPNSVLPPIGSLFPNFHGPGLMPTLPTRPPGGMPSLPTRPPTGAMPTLPTRPPTGVMPTLPGGVTPPIGTLLPGGVTPPIGTLPPTGVTPGLPTRPPTGVMPTLPGGVTPGLPTRPPTGVMPTLPGGVTPPVGTLPPTGVTPGLPTQPPTGVMPTLPGGVTPPVGTLPQTGVTPGLPTRPPGGVTPPIGTLPPTQGPTGVTPGLPMQPPTVVTPGLPTQPPTVVTPGIPGTLPPAAGTLPSTVIQTVPVPRYPTEGAILPSDCPDPRTLANQPPGAAARPECVPKPQCWPDSCQASTEGLDQVPITPGRDLGIGLTKDWNAWTDVRFLSTNDGRYGLDISGWSRSATAGVDRRVGGNVVLGFSATLEDSKVGGYSGFFTSSSRGWTIGPYAAFMLSDNWAVDGALGYSRLTNDYSLAVLDGSYVSQRLTGSANLHGQYSLDFVEVRPRLSFAFVKTFSDAYQMQGSIFGQALNISYPSADYDYSTLELAVEFNKLFTMANGNKLMPFAEVGTLYEMVRPNGGTILNGDLQPFTPSPWSFSAKAGVRMLLSDFIMLEARAGYLSFGQSGLDTVEAKLYLSFSF